MPAKIKKNPSGGFTVQTPNMIHAKSTSKENAIKQQRLLNAIDHGWKPDPYTSSNNKYGGFRRRSKKNG